jgi:hypothetical protein
MTSIPILDNNANQVLNGGYNVQPVPNATSLLNSHKYNSIR